MPGVPGSPADPELVPRPARGRVVAVSRAVGLADVRPDATIRLDAIARVLQDAADADAASASVDGRPVDMGYWLLRRVALRIDHTPRLRAELEAATWCSGVGARWAERRTDVTVGDRLAIESVAIWVHVSPESGRPLPLSPDFHAVWAESARGRQVSARLHHAAPPESAAREPWPLRATDLDVIGHVNNAAYWAPVEEVLARRPGRRIRHAEAEFRAGLDLDDKVDVVTDERDDRLACWLCVGGDVRASALIGFGP